MSQASTPLKVDFTNDRVALQDTRCKNREICKGNGTIRRGQRGYNAESKSNPGHFRIICFSCYSHYKGIEATASAARSGASINSHEIHQMNAAGRIGDPNQAQKHVSAMPRGSMPPPAAIMARPHVSVPCAWDLAAPSSGSLSGASNNWSDKGYSQNHSRYQEAKGFWSKSAYVSRTDEILNLIVGIRYEAEKKPKGEPYGTISEGTTIPGGASAETIFNRVFELMFDRLYRATDYSFSPNDVTVRDVRSWQDIRAVPDRAVPIYYGLYYKVAKNQSKPSWNPPKAPVPVALVVSGPAWKQYREQMHSLEPSVIGDRVKSDEDEPVDSEVLMKDGGDEDNSLPSLPRVQSRAHAKTATKTATKTVTSTATESAATGSKMRTHSQTSASERSRAVSGKSFSITVSKSQRSQSVATSDASRSPSKVGALGSVDWGNSSLHRLSERPRTPETYHAGMKRPYHSPDQADQARLRKALSVGGEALRAGPLDLPTSDHIQFLRVVPRPMSELFDVSRPVRFEFDPAMCEDGTLMVALSASLGTGSFKDAHRGFLTLTPLAPNGLGSCTNQCVAVKRMTQGRDEWGSARRFDVSAEYQHTIGECNLLLWAISLFDLSLSFIDHKLAKTGPLPPSLVIPNIRFVEGGIALVHESTVRKNVQTASSHRRTLVIEELIESPFVKFVHNRAPIPHLAPTHPLFYVAEFLCFTQHVQYEKSGGLVFISDYQGSESLLSDPQIMTAPDILKETMFGGGNVGSLFTVFPTKHKCSGYCRFFGLKPLV